jgi:hypothetical protein
LGKKKKFTVSKNIKKALKIKKIVTWKRTQFRQNLNTSRSQGSLCELIGSTVPTAVIVYTGIYKSSNHDISLENAASVS